VLVPNISSGLIRAIEVAYRKAVDFRHKSIKIFQEAQSSLLSNLSIADWQSKHRLTFVKNFSDTQHSERLDADYFQPRYTEAVDILSRCNYKKLGELTELKKGVQARATTGAIPYASIKDIKGFLLETEDSTNSERLIFVQPNAIVLAITGATIGKVAINAMEKDIAICGDLVAIRPYRVSPYYLLVVMTSPMIKALCNKYTSGTTNGHLPISEVAKFPIPILAEGEICLIESKVKIAIDAHYTSRWLLNIAKRAVEIAVEQNEQIAENWLNEQSRELGQERQ
jgi:hypothetical protein